MLTPPQRIEKEPTLADIYEETFKETQHIAASVARLWASKTSTPYEEILSLAEYALILEIYERDNFKEDMGTKITSWIYCRLFFYVKQCLLRGTHPGASHSLYPLREKSRELLFSQLQTNDNDDIEDTSDTLAGSCQAPPSNRMECLRKDLCEDSQRLLKAVEDIPKHVLASVKPKTPHKKRRIRTLIRQWLFEVACSSWDWPIERVEYAFSEIEEVVATW